MADEIEQQDASPVVADAAPPVAPAAAADEPTPDAPTLTPAEVRALRREAQSLRTRLREFETKQTEAQRAAMTEAERVAADLAALRQQHDAAAAELRRYRLSDAISAAVAPQTLEGETPNPLHGISARLAARLIDPAALEYDEAGAVKPHALRRALEALRREYPELAPAAAAPTAPRIPAQPSAGGKAGQATAADIAARYQAERDSRPNPLRPAVATKG